MAFSLSSQSLLTTPRSSVPILHLSSSKPSKTLEPKPQFSVSFSRRPTPPPLCKPLAASPSSAITHQNQPPRSRRRRRRRVCFRACVSPQDPASTVSSSNEENHQKQLPSLKNLINIYREALQYGDQKSMSYVEAQIGIIENMNCELVEKVASLSAEITIGKEKYIRLQADFDNFRKRSEKEKLTIRSDTKGEVIESLLPMVDSFERAKQQLKPETEKEKKIDTSYQGIYKQFVEIMRSLQVAAVPTVGKPFDPSLHEAIAREKSEEYKEGIITEEFRRGFLLGSRLIRPAMVKVSSGPGIKKAQPIIEQPATAGKVDER
ncbi:hypothetical protein Tsubulata_009640 [Turnera subulata]|uniref:GrpE protein homolog n=1 Tax=Turnera subulata TaxID=218843 RepID=A0A9Q0JNS0_9ROSI|nr:hypothetical protein Tsubulata_009640 [Turnera subulata]